MLLMIDNYDSFTYNLVQYLGELGEDVKVVRNDEMTVEEIEALAPERIVLSPGPCTPNEAGVSLELIETFRGTRADPRRVPRTPGDRPGVRRQGRSREDAHARQGLSNPPSRARASSAACPRPTTRPATIRSRSSASCPAELEVTAWTEDGEIMGVRHRTLPVEGVQFHPESILTQHGHALLRNFLNKG